MKQLANNTNDRFFLYVLLGTGQPVKAKFSLGGFTSELASSLTTVDHEGFVTEIDLESGYCNWTNIEGRKMPMVNINCITLFQ